MSKVEEIRIECTDNGGFVLCYTEKEKPSGAGELVSYNYNQKKESFSPEEGAKALARMAELSGITGKKDSEPENKIEM